MSDMNEKCEEIKLEIDSKTGYIDLVQSVAEKLFELLSFEQEQIYWMSIALREAVNNAIKHGNKEDASKKVNVDFQVYTDKIRILIRDQGSGFNIKEVPDPTNENNIMKSSGRGIFFIKSFMDDLEILESNENGTLIALTKNRLNIN